MKVVLSLLMTLGALLSPLLKAAPDIPTHGLSAFGDLKYAPTFTHFDYVNPKAPKGGLVRRGVFGTFDSFNPFSLKGTVAAGASLLHCSLLAIAEDEPLSLYGYAAEAVELSPDRKSVTFTLNKKAKFSDGTPVTADDVVFSFNILREKGSPLFSQYYKDVKKVEKLNRSQVKFILANSESRELPVILGQLPILSEKYYNAHDFEKADLTPPLGCGPYRVKEAEAGKKVIYERVPDWWAQNIPSQKGLYNFDLAYRYYKDEMVLFEAFRGGDYDFREENVAKNWKTGYKIPAVERGDIILKELPTQLPFGSQVFVFNTRRPIFKDPRVREALTLVFDFEWLNKNLFFNVYKRGASYFNNSELAASGLPEGEELKLLEPFRKHLPSRLFKEPFTLPQTNGSGHNRSLIGKATQLLKEAGWVVQKGQCIHQKTGKPFTFEFLTYGSTSEKPVLALQRNLAALGIKMTIRTLPVPQYIEKVGKHDYDMIMQYIPQTNSPGHEQREMWGSHDADAPHSYNLAGIKDPAIDALVEKVVTAPDRPSLVHRVHALDRALQWGYYNIPTWYKGAAFVAYRNIFGMPDQKPRDGIGFHSWWVVEK